jgi:hypothetical protein
MKNFAVIGFGNIKDTKSGKKAIVLSLDPKAQELMTNEDFAGKIWIFKNKEGSKVPYSVMTTMPEDYIF